jgi:hypothetical protein
VGSETGTAQQDERRKVPAQQDLWNQTSPEVWQRALSRYEEVVAAQEVSDLEELDRWYRETLPGLTRSRQPAHITHEDLERATRWKMKRGVWRQRNLVLVTGNAPEEVERASTEAFAAAPDPRKPIAILSGLAGVGPATASAVMSAHSPEVYPFFDELVAAQIPGLGEVAFTPAYYARYAEHLRQRAQSLTEASNVGRAWTANDVGLALWAASGGKAAQ